MKETVKKLLSIILSMLILLSTMPMTTFATDGDELVYRNPYTDCYTVIEVVSEAEKTCKITEMEVICRDYGEETIPTEIEGYKVVSIGWNAFLPIEVPGVVVPDSIKDFGNMFVDNTVIEHIKLGSGFNKFDADLFTGMSSLEKVIISENHPNYCTVDGVVFDKEMKTLIFYPENKQTSVYAIPDSVTTIGENAFGNVKNLTKLYIPETVTNVKDDTFVNCSTLAEIYYRNDVADGEAICEYEFVNADNIKLTYYKDSKPLVTVPQQIDSYTVVGVADDAFKDCIYATEIVLPKTVTQIGKLGAPVLQKFNIPASAETISSNVFDGCDLLKTVTTSAENTNYSVKNNMLFDSTGTVLVACPDNLSDRVVIPDGTVEIKDYAFANFNHTLTVNVPDSVTTIGVNAFANTEVVIFGSNDSYAKTYATDNALNFFILVANVTLPNGTTDTYGIFDAFAVAQENAGAIVTLIDNADIATQRKSVITNKVVYEANEIQIEKGDITLDLDDYTITAFGSGAISVEANAKLTITTNKSGGVYGNICVSGLGELVVNGGYFESDNDVLSVAGHLVVNGGTFVSTADDSSWNTTGYAIVFWHDETVSIGGYRALGTGQIYGGIFKGGIDIFYMQGMSSKLKYSNILAPGYSFYLFKEQDTKVASSSGFKLEKEDVVVDKTHIADVNGIYYYSLSSALNVAKDNAGSTLTLLENIDLDRQTLEVDNGQFNVNMNGKTITSKNSEANLVICENATVNIYDDSGKGAITNTNEKAKSVITNYGNLTLNNINVNGAVIDNGESLTLENGTEIVGRLKSSGNLATTDTTISAFSDAVTIENNGNTTVTFGDGTKISGGLSINNGENTPITLADITADGYYFYTAKGKVDHTKTEIKDYTLLYQDAEATVTVDDVVTCYDTFDEALTVAEATPNSTLTLLEDLDLENKTLNIDDGNFAFDINGNTITSAGTAICISREADVVITDNTGKGKVQGEWGIQTFCFGTIENIEIIATGYYGVIADNPDYISGKTLAIKNCKITSAKYGVYMMDGYISIKDCEITGDTNAMFVYAESHYVESICLENVKLNNGIYIDIVPEDGSVIYSRYYLKDTLPEGFAYYDADGNLVKLKSTDVILEGNVSVKAQYEVSGTDQDGNTTYYPTIEDALDATENDIHAKLKLLADILRNSNLNFNGTTTLDFNGKTISSESDYAISVNENATLNIENGEINNTILVNGGTLNFNSGVINSETNGVHNDGGTFNMIDGEITAGDGYVDIFVEGDSETNFMGGAYADGFTVGGATVNDVLADGYAFYDNYVGVELSENQTEIDSNVIVLEKTIVSAMSSQIRFNMKEDGTYKGTFDVRTRAKISDADFKKYIASSNQVAMQKITKAGFVYSTATTDFSVESAKIVAQGGTVDGFADSPVSHILDADGYYTFNCMVTGITEDELDNGLTVYAYICVEDTWYFFPIEMTTEFGEIYDTYYVMAAEQYGWVI